MSVIQGAHVKKRQGWHFRLQIYISALFALIVLLVGAMISGISYMQSRKIIESDAIDVTQRMSRATVGAIQRLEAPAEMAVRLVSRSALPQAGTLDARMAQLPMLREALRQSSMLDALYIGYANGDHFAIRQVLDEAGRVAQEAPPGTRYVIQNIERNPAHPDSRYLYLDEALTIIKQEQRPSYAASYDPRPRPWYKQAMQDGDLIHTAPFRFATIDKIGVTLAMPSPERGAVVACNISLEALQETLNRQKNLPGMHLALVDDEGRLIAADSADSAHAPIVDKLVARIRALGGTQAGKGVPVPVDEHTEVELDERAWTTSLTRLPLDDDESLYLVSAVPTKDLLYSANRLRWINVVVTAAILLATFLLTWLVAGRIAHPLRRLVGDAERIRHFDLTARPNVKSGIDEVDQLGEAMGDMRHTITRFLDSIHTMVAEPSFEKLLPHLLTGALDEVRADAGVLYLIDEHGVLQPASAMNAQRQDLTDKLNPLLRENAPALIRTALNDGKSRTDLLIHGQIDQAGLRPLLHSHSSQVAVVPLTNRQGTLVGIFVLLCAEPVEKAELSFISALSGLMVSAIETRELIKAQRNLFEAFIQLIAQAIDAKSHYTGGHCNRVPELTKMLAQAACDASSGPYRDFRLGELEWEELHVAAWLHDCGKITTPEYVVDKATKLETIYDRIHEIRMRFEVLKRDAEIACLQSLADGVDAAQARAERDAALRQLDEDFAFVATCNEGGEYMGEASIERLRRIGERTWMRTLDDRLGVSREERKRKERMPAAPLPVVETLLADKEEHRIERADSDLSWGGDNPWGFKMGVPELLYNRGELYNLSVSRGTLSAEERFKINEHILQTIMMLSQLPFPRHMRNVAEIAGGHHEKMDGTGYPKRLSRDEMSDLSRMMAIADIFEALTAIDRPYKKGKTLSESIRIMATMRDEQHIDAALFELFLRSGVYLEYARRFMLPEQIDEVDVDAYFEAPPHERRVEDAVLSAS
jgi:HD-GYP domain-containing protein (c-di-GMP phosphodiesterase class II)/HAMP domain-containing protein